MNRESVDWRGYIPAVTTPFTAGLELDRDGWRAQLDWLLAERMHGIAVAGTTGEWFSLTAPERPIRGSGLPPGLRRDPALPASLLRSEPGRGRRLVPRSLGRGGDPDLRLQLAARHRRRSRPGAEPTGETNPERHWDPLLAADSLSEMPGPAFRGRRHFAPGPTNC